MNKKTFLTRILDKALELNASDIHISVNNKVAFRDSIGLKKTDDFGKLNIRDTISISEELLENVSKNMKNYLLKELDIHGHIGFGFKTSDNYKYRVNMSKYIEGYYIVMRKNTANPIDLKELGFNQETMIALDNIAKKEAGLFLVVGQTGSGKSTTLASMIKGINQVSEKNIITLEDPIEYEHISNKSVVVQKELGRDLVDFNEGLRSALREDPDIILVGEIRDSITLDLALKAAETGHLVFSTLHTESSISTIQRILSMSPAGTEDFVRNRLSDSLLGVIAQKLIKGKERKVLLWDILIMNVAAANELKENSINQLKASLDNMPMSQSYEKTLVWLFNAGKLSMEECLRYTNDKESFGRAIASNY